MPAPAMKQTVEVGKPGEYTIAIGDSLKRSNDDGDIFTSVKYNFKPTAALSNPQPPRLTKHAPTGPSPFTLTLTPPGTPAKPITYTGSQHVHLPRKTECILLFDPTTQSFTLEKLSSTFTFNAKVYAPANPALPLRPPIPDGEETDEEEREDDNPFDYRHFINKKPTTKTRAEQKAERSQRRKEALKRAGKDIPSDESGEENEEDQGLGISYNGRPVVSGKGFLASPAIGPRRNIGGKSPFGGKKPVAMSPGMPLPSPAHRHESSSDEDDTEADDEDEDEDDEQPPPPPLQPPQRVLSKKPAASRKKAQPIEELELVFPEPNVNEDISEEEEISEESESELTGEPSQLQAEEEDDDLAAMLAKELENSDVDVDVDADGDADADADAEIIFEDDGEIRSGGGGGGGWGNGGTGAATTTGGPISFAGLVGADDDSETSEEE